MFVNVKFFCNMHHQSLFVKFFHTAWNLFSLLHNMQQPITFYCLILQMCIDVEKSTIYVFGGRVLTRQEKKEKKSLYIKRFTAEKAERICLFFLHIFIRRAKSSSFFFSSSGDERAQETLFSGLYSYNCQTNTWNKLK